MIIAPNYKRFIFWLLIATLAILFLGSISSVMLPFAAGMLIAYLLDPLVDRMEKFGLARGYSTAITSVMFYLIIFGSFAALFPLLYDQLVNLWRLLPDYIVTVKDKYLPMAYGIIDNFSAEQADNARASLKQATDGIFKNLTSFLIGIWSSSMSFVNVMGLIIITPIVSFYLLRDWDVMKSRISSLSPRYAVNDLKYVASECDKVISGYLRGQIYICLILATFYAISLTLAGLQFGLIIGIMTGLMAFIPYIGVFIGMAVGITVALFQFDELMRTAIIIAIFAFGQFVEGNFITPKIMSNSIGLHPVWIMFALLAGGALLGFFGILIAVPFAAVIGVVIKYLVEKYKVSILYKG